MFTEFKVPEKVDTEKEKGKLVLEGLTLTIVT